jgi:hypothetical protein
MTGYSAPLLLADRAYAAAQELRYISLQKSRSQCRDMTAFLV